MDVAGSPGEACPATNTDLTISRQRILQFVTGIGAVGEDMTKPGKRAPQRLHQELSNNLKKIYKLGGCSHAPVIRRPTSSSYGVASPASETTSSAPTCRPVLGHRKRDG